MIVSCRRTPFEFAPIRTFLHKVGYQAEKLPEKLATLLLDPLDDRAIEVRRSSHLTDATDRDTQLRFYSDRLVHQHLLTIAYAVAHQCRDLTRLELHHGEHLSAGASLFFRVLARHLPGCDIRVRFGGSSDDSDRDTPVVGEERVRRLYYREARLTDEQFELLFDAARRCSYVGDYWTSERLLTKLERNRHHQEVNVLLGVAANATARPFLAEHYFGRNYRGTDAVDKVRACYSLAMLCIRHHAPTFLDLERGEAYLQEAFDILHGLDPDGQDPYLSFRKVFNRNGYALVLFRRKRVSAALALLDKGLARLADLTAGPVALHQSVLVYNKMLCHRALDDTANEQACFDRLVELDPRYPYYRTRCVNPVWFAWVTVLQGGEHGTDEQWPRAAA